MKTQLRPTSPFPMVMFALLEVMVLRVGMTTATAVEVMLVTVDLEDAATTLTAVTGAQTPPMPHPLRSLRAGTRRTGHECRIQRRRQGGRGEPSDKSNERMSRKSR